jgi:secreted trypsin-like serine protease
MFQKFLQNRRVIMWKFVAILSLFAIAASATPSIRHRYELNAMKYDVDRETRSGRIVGGVDSKIEDFPYIISLRFNNRHTCGGSILNEDTVVSAAHCTFGRNHANFQILAGYTNNTHGTSIVVTQVIQHPMYDDWTLENDVVILKLAERIVFDDRRQPIVLPTPNFNVAAGRLADLSGWGALAWRGSSPQILQGVKVPVLSNEQCQVIYDEEEILVQHICAGEEGRDACQGDSGGP